MCLRTALWLPIASNKKFGKSQFLGSSSYQSVLGCIDMTGFVNDDVTSNSLSSRLSAHAELQICV
jgi:hypothetical protein